MEAKNKEMMEETLCEKCGRPMKENETAYWCDTCRIIKTKVPMIAGTTIEYPVTLLISFPPRWKYKKRTWLDRLGHVEREEGFFVATEEEDFEDEKLVETLAREIERVKKLKDEKIAILIKRLKRWEDLEPS